MEYGTVKFFSKVRGFGFVTADIGDELFAHYTQILTGEAGQRNLVIDQRVRFERKPNRVHPGKFMAAKIEIVDEPVATASKVEA